MGEPPSYTAGHCLLIMGDHQVAGADEAMGNFVKVTGRRGDEDPVPAASNDTSARTRDD